MKNSESIRHFLRVLALSYPDVVEEFPWGDCAFKIRKKAFLFMGSEPPTVTFSVKLPHTGELALDLSFTEPTGYGLGKHGWVTARVGPDEDVSLDMIASWLDESYRAIAPKKLVAQLNENDSPHDWSTS
ncbi:MAG: hypothetical protein BMS9Abin05_1556 [Rhodothermia bacterium]|nr:MAG: hypothetical protein BMS9Abin05_1556 [Rhodothermia bacterium]